MISDCALHTQMSEPQEEARSNVVFVLVFSFDFLKNPYLDDLFEDIWGSVCTCSNENQHLCIV